MDQYDEEAVHYLLSQSDVPIGTARLLNKNGFAKIGRMAIVSQERHKGLGLLLMRYVMNDAFSRGFQVSILDAQAYAVPFYTKLGYVVEGDVFSDAGIPHLHMRGNLARVFSS
jgi:predicted GNAT family N-acyltransferase